MAIGDFYKKLNILLSTNRNAKTQEARVKVINNNRDFLQDLRKHSDDIDKYNKTLGYNPYRSMIKSLSTWILKGSTNDPKNYKSTLKNENPSEFKDNLATQAKTYKGKSNYYVDPKVTINESDLNNKYIKQIYINLKFLKSDLKHKIHNRFKVSKAIFETEQDLREAIINYRGVDEFNRTDNEPTAKTQGRIHKIKDPMVKLLYYGYNESEIATKLKVSVATVSRHLHSLVTTHN